MNLGHNINEVFHSFGYHVKPIDEIFGYQRNELMRSYGIDLVIDVGANVGQYGEEIRRYGYRGRICSFEPVSSAFGYLEKRAARDGNWTAVRAALGEANATLRMNVSGHSASSSLLPMLGRLADVAPESKYVATEDVSVARLDEAWDLQAYRSENALLKLDTQGYEAMVLKGAAGVLSHIKLIECELSTVALYDGQLLLIEMLNLFDELGFESVNFAPVFFDPKSRKCLQLNGIFARWLVA